MAILEQILTIKDLSFGYTGKPILNNINLSINKGSFTSIVGENGSGKTTLIKCLIGLNTGFTGVIEHTCKLGYLPQRTDIQTNFPASVKEVVLSGTIANNLRGIFYNKADKKLADDVMEELDVYKFRHKCFRELSGGQQQRVLLARALCATKDLVVLDEPVNGLDAPIVKQIYSLLEKLNKEKGLSIIMVSHDLNRAKEFCSNVIELNSGDVAFNGTPEEYEKVGGRFI